MATQDVLIELWSPIHIFWQLSGYSMKNRRKTIEYFYNFYLNIQRAVWMYEKKKITIGKKYSSG